jgi:hypothetical protein
VRTARDLVGADRCSIFVLDREVEELVACLFDSRGVDQAQKAGGPRGQTQAAAPSQIRFSLNESSIAGVVAKTGQPANVADAYAHPSFNRTIDELTGYRTRSLLCVPLSNGEDTVAVAQLVNKLPKRPPAGGSDPLAGDWEAFSKEDEESVSAFGIFCGLALSKALYQEKITKSEFRLKVALETLAYHRRPSDQACQDLVASFQNNHMTGGIPDAGFDIADATQGSAGKEIMGTLNSFSFNPYSLIDKEMLQARFVVSMFINLDYTSKFHIPLDVLCRFTLTVKKSYRNEVPYHNFIHGVQVAHMMYMFLRSCSKGIFGRGWLTDIEGFALLTACLCHDLDHRGRDLCAGAS